MLLDAAEEEVGVLPRADYVEALQRCRAEASADGTEAGASYAELLGRVLAKVSGPVSPPPGGRAFWFIHLREGEVADEAHCLVVAVVRRRSA